MSTTSQKGEIMQRGFDQKQSVRAWWNHVWEKYTSGGKEMIWKTAIYDKKKETQ